MTQSNSMEPRPAVDGVGGRRALQISAIASILASGWIPVIGQGIPEPDTLLYGRVLNWNGPRPVTMTNGLLTWQVRHGEGAGDLVFLATRLRAMGPEPLSYRLEIPHAAAVPGAPFDRRSFLPLGTEETVLRHGVIQVDGWPARIVGPQGGRVAVSQPLRAATHRLDLQVSYPLPDSDGDGLPDWWEAHYSLSDANADPDGDGRSNLQEYREGTDPKAASTTPFIRTRSVSVYTNSTGGLILQSTDGDSAASQLIYTLNQLPEGIEVRRILGNGGEAPLAVGATFSQEEADRGRLRWVHVGGREPFRLRLTLRDEDPLHTPDAAEIEIRILHPNAIAAATALWLDAAVRGTAGVPSPRDRLASDLSGNGRNGEWTPAGDPPGSATNAPGDLQAARLSGQFLAFTNVPDEGLAGGDAVTAFAAFRSESTGAQQLLADGRLGIGLLGEVSGDGARVEFHSGGRRVRSQALLGAGWTVVSGWRDGDHAGVEVNGLGAGSVAETRPDSQEYLRPGLGALSRGNFDLGTGRWNFRETNAFHGAVGEVAVFPGALPADQRRRLGYALLGKWAGHVFWDASTQGQPVHLRVALGETNRNAYAQGTIRDRSHILLGTPGPDVLEGGMEGDILDGGLGGDSLTGHGGADAFVFSEPDAAVKRIEDFRPDEGDVLDLSGLLTGSSVDLDDYIEVQRAGTNTVFRVSAAGAGVGFTNLVIECVNRVWTQADLQSLWADGGLRLGGRRILPDTESGTVRIHVRSEVGMASEEGPQGADFILRRTGLADEALSVALFLGGAARNGQDYSFVPASAVFPAGVREIRVGIRPLPDGEAEPAEVVELTVLPGGGYEPGDSEPARIWIEDLPLRVSVEALSGAVDRQGNDVAHLVVRRKGVLGQHTLVRLRFAGDAVPGSDYLKPPEHLEFTSGQAEALVPIRIGPSPGPGIRTVEIHIAVPDGATYRAGEPAMAVVRMIGAGETFVQWCARWFGETREVAEASGHQDDDEDGIPRLHEFAFGLNPKRAEAGDDGGRWPRWVGGTDGRPELLVRRAPEALGLEFEAFESVDFRMWRRLEPAVAGGEAGTWRFRSRDDPQPEPWFLRLVIRTLP